MARDINDILNDATPEVEAYEAEPVEPTETEAQPETIGQPRDDSGRFAKENVTGEEIPAEEPQTEAPPAPEPEAQGQLAALKDERRKRQEAEQRAAFLEQQFKTMQQPAPQQQEPEPDFWDNPQRVIASQVQKAVIEALQAEKQQQTMARIDESESKARAAYADYDDAFHAFHRAASVNPSLVQQMTQASDPAEFAYKTGKSALDLQRVGSIDELLAAERARWEQEAAQAIQPRQQAPFTTATARSVGERGVPAFTGPKPISAILKE